MLADQVKGRKGNAPGLESGLLSFFRLLSPLVFFCLTRMMLTFFLSRLWRGVCVCVCQVGGRWTFIICVALSKSLAGRRSHPSNAFCCRLAHPWSTFTTARQKLLARGGQPPVCVSASESLLHAYQTSAQILSFSRYTLVLHLSIVVHKSIAPRLSSWEVFSMAPGLGKGIMSSWATSRLEHSALQSEGTRSLRHWNWQEEKMNWVPGFNHDPCELKEAGTLEPAVLPGALKQFQL